MISVSLATNRNTISPRINQSICTTYCWGCWWLWCCTCSSKKPPS